mgnify:CR=1 FL=1
MTSIYKQQREMVKRKVHDTAIRLFREKGYDRVSIDQITKTVGIAKGTFYNFYASKKDILMQWALGQFEAIDVQSGFSPDGTIRENMSRVIGIIVSAIEDQGALFVSFLKELIRGYKDASVQFDFVTIFSEVIRGSSDFSTVAEDFGPKLQVLNNALFLAIFDWFSTPEPAEPLKKHLEKTLSICLYGMMAR